MAFFLEALLELLALLLVRDEPHHFEDLVEALQVNFLVCVRVQVEDLAEVATVRLVDSGFVRRSLHYD